MTILRGLVVSLLLLLLCSRANAEVGFSKAQCIEANGKAQSLRREGKFAQAREQLRMCSNSKCPNLVSTDCTKRLDELESVQPTLVFDVTDSSGRDLSEVTLSMDGAPLSEKLDGSALPVDPGEHEFAFAVAGVPPLHRHLVVREGERGRHERVVVATPTPSVASKSSPAEDGSSPSSLSRQSSSGGGSTQKVLGVSLAGLGVAALTVGAVFGVMTKAAADRQRTTCASTTSCMDYDAAASQHADAQRKGTISTVSFIAGAALLTGGFALFLTAKPAAEQSARSERLGLLVSAGPSATALLLHGKF